MKFLITSLVLFLSGAISILPAQEAKLIESVNWYNRYYSRVNLEHDTLQENSCSYQTSGLDFIRNPEESLTWVWGGGNQFKGVYPDELLPAVFSRKIVFDDLLLENGGVKWIFSGSRAAFNIELTDNSVELHQRFYDSWAFHNVKQNDTIDKLPRYPEETFIKAKAEYTGEVSSLTATVGHDMIIRVFLNEKQIIEQHCLFDVTRHQLGFYGKQCRFQGTILKPEVKSASITMDSTKKHQKILGFGAINSVVSYHELSETGQRLWWEYIQDYNLLIQREYPNGVNLKADFSNWDKLEDASIHYYGDNFPNGEISDFSFNKKIQDLGGLVIFEFWQLPLWALKSGTIDGKLWHNLPVLDKYAGAIVNYCQTALEKTGKAPAIVGIQNEIEQPHEIWRKMTLTLRKALDDNGFQEVKIHMHNAPTVARGVNAAMAFTEEAEVWDQIDYAACNVYDFQRFFRNADGFDQLIDKWNLAIRNKPFLSVEQCVNRPYLQHGSYRVAFSMGQLYHKNMSLLNAEAIIYCWGLLNGPHESFDASRSLFKIDYHQNSIPVPSSFQLRVFGSFSRHIKRDMQRIGAKSTHDDILVTAYKNREQQTMVVLNRGISPYLLSIEQLAGYDSVEITSQFFQNRIMEVNKIADGYKILIQGGEIFTFFIRK